MKLIRLLTVALLAGALISLTACGGDDEEPAPRSVELLSTSQTILGQPIEYPTSGPLEIGSSIVTLQPGEETGWHHHDAPLYAYILEGAVTVNYGDDGVRIYREGEAFMEAVGTSHNGVNDGDEQVRILVVNLGAAGVANSVADE
jgi:quercetin dioxygenase-like cupin family protein